MRPVRATMRDGSSSRGTARARDETSDGGEPTWGALHREVNEKEVRGTKGIVRSSSHQSKVWHGRVAVTEMLRLGLKNTKLAQGNAD